MKRRSKQSKVSIRRLLCVLLLIIGISTFSSIRVSSKNVSYDPPSYPALTTHDPINITSDSGLEVFPGSGTVEDPYVIDGYNITTAEDNGIYITDTTKYFTVCNCYVDASDYGIIIEDVADGTAVVINNTCSNNMDGILLWYSGSSTVINNTCNNNNNKGIFLSSSNSSTVINNTCSNNNNYGIYLWYSGSTTVANNTCSNNGLDGIVLDDTGSSNVINNTCNNNEYGIQLDDSGSTTVANNTFSNNYYGIYLLSSGSLTIVNNTFTNCGLYFFGSAILTFLSNSVENNWVNGRKIGYYTNLDSTIIDEPVYGQLILVNCINVTVRDQILNNASIGLFLYSCRNSSIINNTCSNNNKYGIRFYVSGSSNVANNTCNNNNVGIYIRSSDSVTVASNTCNNNGLGIKVASSVSVTVANNTCSNNGLGIILFSSGSATVANNTCTNNDDGILLLVSDSCIVTYNLLQENEDYGVNLNDDSDNNLIHHNTFVDNNLGGTSQANDDCANNFWYDTETSEGNYWSDWSGTGNYVIDGSAGSVDLYPFGPPVVSTTVESTTDKTKISFTFTLLIVLVPLVLIKKFYRKRR